MRKTFIIILFSLFYNSSFAQINELGIFVGGSNYIGDIGKTTYINPNDLAYGLVYKWNFNPRIAFRVTYTHAQISADDKNSNNIVRQNRGLRFNNTINEIGLGIEFNFLKYNISQPKLNKTPYFIIGVELSSYNVINSGTNITNYTYTTKNQYIIPIGIGFKTKLFNNIGFAIESRINFTFADDLDYNNFDLPGLNYGNPSSSDWYVITGVSFVYAFGRKACYKGSF